MSKLMQRVALAAVVVVTSLLWVEPEARRMLGGVASQGAKETLAQRYPLRSRSNNFFNRSKISATSKSTSARR